MKLRYKILFVLIAAVLIWFFNVSFWIGFGIDLLCFFSIAILMFIEWKKFDNSDWSTNNNYEPTDQEIWERNTKAQLSKHYNYDVVDGNNAVDIDTDKPFNIVPARHDDDIDWDV